jgi:uncharacterized protein (TIGR03086 family)
MSAADPGPASAEAAASADVVDLYIRALAAFGNQVVALSDEQWLQTTPCPEWDALTLCAHVVLGEAQVVEMIDGHTSPADRAMEVGILGSDPVAAWRGTALRAIEEVRVADLDTVVKHPLGPQPLSRVLGFRITDNLVHAWDLSVVRDDPMELDSEIAQWCLDFWLPMADSLTASGYFGPMTEPADDTPGARLLALLGRRA